MGVPSRLCAVCACVNDVGGGFSGSGGLLAGPVDVAYVGEGVSLPLVAFDMPLQP